MRILILLLFLAACGRGLSDGEIQMTRELMGDSFDAAPARFLEVGMVGMVTRHYPVRPQVTCREKIAPPPDGPTFATRTAGMVAWETVLTNPDWTLPDYLPDYPQEMNLVAAMYFAHEMTHIWQWQNRDITGYSPLRGAAEHQPGADPYLIDDTDQTPFLSLGYEQQAALVEEYVCCRTLDPSGARTLRLWERLRSVMPVQHPSLAPRPIAVRGVHADTDINGICS